MFSLKHSIQLHATQYITKWILKKNTFTKIQPDLSPVLTAGVGLLYSDWHGKGPYMQLNQAYNKNEPSLPGK